MLLNELAKESSGSNERIAPSAQVNIRDPTRSQQAIFPNIDGLIIHYAKSYIELWLRPVGFGFCETQEILNDLDWRNNREDMVKLHSIIQEMHNYAI